MDLRLAFGPGTRLWAQRSREELCYDWLRYKAKAPHPSFREFGRMLFAREVRDSPGRRDLYAILRRIATVLRSHRVWKAPRFRGLVTAPRPAAIPGSGSLQEALPGTSYSLSTAHYRFEGSLP